MSPTSLALLAPLFTAQLDGVTIALKDVVAHVEAIRATAQAAGCETVAAQVAGCETAPAERPVKKKPGYDSGPSDDPDRIVSIAEAARLSSLSIDTLRRRHRDKWLQLSERRFGMRRRDVLLL